jgi:hypothetical protein
MSIYLRILAIGLIGLIEYVLLYHFYSSKNNFIWITAITIFISGILAGLIFTKLKVTSPLWLTLLSPLVAMPISAIINLAIDAYLHGFNKDIGPAFLGIMISQNIVFLLVPQVTIPVLGLAYLTFMQINKIN